MYSFIAVMFLSFAYAKFPTLVPRILSFMLCNLGSLIDSVLKCQRLLTKQPFNAVHFQD